MNLELLKSWKSSSIKIDVIWNSGIEEMLGDPNEDGLTEFVILKDTVTGQVSEKNVMVFL